ncbi:hypothetical protein IMSHALPRED_007814 [Imshaugia aleurites]|uniref:Uncharacterized protein n=1 Tax=Imshaugia aleurites TaxID=172621 RepID=A0A8H3FSC1_9LECA|nr:hypothetical protein IMSHALPRED_007814 [Imshaugia aleurites]
MQDPSLGELGTDQPLAILGYASIDPQPSARDLAARRRLLSGYLYRELRGELPRGGGPVVRLPPADDRAPAASVSSADVMITFLYPELAGKEQKWLKYPQKSLYRAHLKEIQRKLPRWKKHINVQLEIEDTGSFLITSRIEGEPSISDLSGWYSTFSARRSPNLKIRRVKARGDDEERPPDDQTIQEILVYLQHTWRRLK